VASFDHTILPGGEGKITIKVHTDGYEGPVHKSALVNSNDPENGVIHIGIKAFVKVAVLISPRYVSLNGKNGESITGIVEIKAGLDKPLKLTPDALNLEGKLTYRIEEVEKGREFKIYFTSIPGSPQTYYGFLNLKTNYPERPIVSIGIKGHFVKDNKRKTSTLLKYDSARHLSMASNFSPGHIRSAPKVPWQPFDKHMGLRALFGKMCGSWPIVTESSVP